MTSSGAQVLIVAVDQPWRAQDTVMRSISDLSAQNHFTQEEGTESIARSSARMAVAQCSRDLVGEVEARPKRAAVLRHSWWRNEQAMGQDADPVAHATAMPQHSTLQMAIRLEAGRLRRSVDAKHVQQLEFRGRFLETAVRVEHVLSNQFKVGRGRAHWRQVRAQEPIALVQVVFDQTALRERVGYVGPLTEVLHAQRSQYLDLETQFASSRWPREADGAAPSSRSGWRGGRASSRRHDSAVLRRSPLRHRIPVMFLSLVIYGGGVAMAQTTYAVDGRSGRIAERKLHLNRIGIGVFGGDERHAIGNGGSRPRQVADQLHQRLHLGIQSRRRLLQMPGQVLHIHTQRTGGTRGWCFLGVASALAT